MLRSPHPCFRFAERALVKFPHMHFKSLEIPVLFEEIPQLQTLHKPSIKPCGLLPLHVANDNGEAQARPS